MKRFLVIILTVLFSACSPMEPALTFSDNPSLENHEVKGRHGLMVSQKMRFGEFQTSKVKRSWTKGSDYSFRAPVGIPGPTFPDMMSLEFTDRNQTFHFEMNDSNGNKSSVFAASQFESETLQIGNNPNSILNITKDIIGIEAFSENLFYIQMFINDHEQPWQLVLDNQAAQLHAKSYTGIFAMDDEHFYTLKPVNLVKTKKGPRQILMGSIGFEIFDSMGKSVAGVSLIDQGKVYFNTTNPQEKFILANLCAALLLQENIAE